MTLPRLLPWLLRALPLAVAIAATTAHADTLVVRVAPDLAVPVEEVRAVVAAELGATIVKEAPDLGTLDIHLDATGRLVVEYRRPSGDVLVRIVTLPQHPADRLSVIAFVTGNLVRDQLDGLAPPGADAVPVAADGAAPEPALAATPPTGAPSAAPTVAPVVAPVASNVTVGASVERATPESVVPFTIGLIPPLSTDTLLGAHTTVHAGIYAIAGATTNIEGFSISGAADIARGNLRGVQIGGAFVSAQNSVGLQIGGAAALAYDMRGIQIGGAASLARDTVGLQIAGAGVLARDLRGIQIGGAATVARDALALQIAGAGALARDFRGIQIAGAAGVVRDMYGLQIAGAASVAQRMEGLQLAGGATVAGQVDGAQIASINVAGNVEGFQLGAINVGKHVHGLQVGAINISDDIDGAPIGAISIVRHGRTDVDAWAETTGLAAVALRHGSRRVHNIYAIGFTPDGGDTPLVGLGIGLHNRLGGAALDLDGLTWQTHMFQDGVGLLTQARATVAISFGAFDAFVAAAYNVSVEDTDSKRPVRTMFARTINEPMSSSVDVALWPSLSAGVRGHLGGPR